MLHKRALLSGGCSELLALRELHMLAMDIVVTVRRFMTGMILFTHATAAQHYAICLERTILAFVLTVLYSRINWMRWPGVSAVKSTVTALNPSTRTRYVPRKPSKETFPATGRPRRTVCHFSVINFFRA